MTYEIDTHGRATPLLLCGAGEAAAAEGEKADRRAREVSRRFFQMMLGFLVEEGIRNDPGPKKEQLIEEAKLAYQALEVDRVPGLRVVEHRVAGGSVHALACVNLRHLQEDPAWAPMSGLLKQLRGFVLSFPLRTETAGI